MNKIWRIFIFLITLSIFSTPTLAQYEIPVIDIEKHCQEEERIECHEACLDGWATACYYDASQYQLEKNLNLQSQKDKCYAFYDMSVCAPCRNIFQIEGKDVSCDEFYRSINEKNQKCNGCLKLEGVAGG